MYETPIKWHIKMTVYSILHKYSHTHTFPFPWTPHFVVWQPGIKINLEKGLQHMFLHKIGHNIEAGAKSSIQSSCQVAEMVTVAG